MYYFTEIEEKGILGWIFLYKVKNVLYKQEKMIEDLVLLWMTELTFNCIAMVSENCFTSVSHGVWRRWTCIPAHDDCTTHHSSSAFLGFASETVFLMSPHKFSVGLRSGDWAARLLACLGLLSCWKGHFLFGMRQYKQVFQCTPTDSCSLECDK